jgi:hypothetical protein
MVSGVRILLAMWVFFRVLVVQRSQESFAGFIVDPRRGRGSGYATHVKPASF